MNFRAYAFITAAVIGIWSYTTVSANWNSDTVYSQTCISGSQMIMTAGSFKAIKWETGRTITDIATDNQDVNVTNYVGSDNSVYTYIDASGISVSMTVHINVYFNDTEYYCLTVIIGRDAAAGTTVPSQATTRPSSSSSQVPHTNTGTKATTTSRIPSETTGASGPGEADQTTSEASRPDIDTPSESTSEGSSLSEYLPEEPFAYRFTTWGDIDLNYIVDMSDMTILCQFLVGDIELNSGALLAADVIPSANQIPDLADLAHLKQFIMKDNVKLGPTDIIYI